MSCSVPAFWRLAQESGLLTASRCRELSATWRAMKGTSRASSARTLAEWLAAERVITRYQAKVLLAGQPGPFCYGEYRVAKRLRPGGLVDCFAVRWMRNRRRPVQAVEVRPHDAPSEDRRDGVKGSDAPAVRVRTISREEAHA